MTQKIENWVLVGIAQTMLFLIISLSVVAYLLIGSWDVGTYVRVVTTLMLVVVNVGGTIFFIRESWSILRS